MVIRKYRRRYRPRRYIRRRTVKQIHRPIGSGPNAKRFFKLKKIFQLTSDIVEVSYFICSS